ncbi:phosphatase PAP2 family protein [sulfur-oxidizing endosymbiont of Gigantopelta aegis]|uniref:phosphatase PAP2 family protein n=1 Tax=sulfur-oxidizing endosymbiont of Gigantopelta aegis TaxID=2794934 RepID=UPI0018DB43CE|nr:phosphatase PAP2 family protein [sulfur-oxidizing endosymbiont of Gigantopelta aegis]
MTVKNTVKNTFFMSHLFLPLIIYIVAIFMIYQLQWDYSLSLYFYDMQNGAWLLKDNFYTEVIIHHYGKYLAIAGYLLLTFLYIISFFKRCPIRLAQAYHKGLEYLVISTIVATLSITLLKSLTQIDCPWSISGLGGDIAYYDWLNRLFVADNGGKCFPSGHASAAYAFFSLYFFAYHYFPKQAWKVLLVVASAGLIFGFSQQLRGAHFISHDVTTVFICWMINLFFYRYFLAKEPTI